MQYQENTAVEEMLSLGITSVPVLCVDGQMMDFANAVKWINNQGDWWRMDITLKLSKDFERCLEDLKKKYGEDFEYINGLHPSQLDFSEFIDNFVDKDTLADASIDPNANANHKDIRSFMTEKAKSEDKL